jgi:WD40 repeat protein
LDDEAALENVEKHEVDLIEAQNYFTKTVAAAKQQRSGGTRRKFFTLLEDEDPNLPVSDCHTGPVHSISFNPEGNRFATCSKDKMIKIWSHPEVCPYPYPYPYPLRSGATPRSAPAPTPTPTP